MPLISGTIPSLVNGVSQQPASLRMPTQGEAQENAYSHISRGLEKRPCSEHIAKIDGMTSVTSNDVFIHTIRRSEDEAYALIIKGGTSSSGVSVKLYDLTGFATGTAGDEVFIHKVKIPDDSTSGTGFASGEVLGNSALDTNVAGYLGNFVTATNAFSPSKLSATTIADFTFLLNRTQAIRKVTSTTQDTRPYEALLHFKVGDYDATYNITITEYNIDSTTGEKNPASPKQTLVSTYKTPDNEVSTKVISDITRSLNNQDAVVVSHIARTFAAGDTDDLTLGVLGDTTYTNGVISKGTFSGTRLETGALNAATSVGNPWTLTYRSGESIMYIENNANPFVIEVTDGKGDTFVRAINGSDEVPSFSHLPVSKFSNNFVARVSGDTTTGQDDYYVKWNGAVWKETAKPQYPAGLSKNSRKSIDSNYMPMQLNKEFDASGDIYFVLKPVTWDARAAGDDTTNPFPSFANYDEIAAPNGLYTINDIFFHRNRLGFVSDENVILSESASYFNFFANTVLTVLDTATIDVAVSNNQVAILKSAIPFQESLLLFSDLQQFKLTSDEFLTPTSVMIDVASGFETSTDAAPVPAGKTIFFPFQRGSYSGIREYMIDQNTRTNDANEITTHIPEYIGGTVKKLAVSSNEETLCVLSDTDRKILFVYKYYYADQEKLQSSWSKWTFDAEIIDMGFIGSIGFLLFRRGEDIYLEKINLSVDVATTIMDDKIGVRLDRRVKLESTEITDITPTPSAAWATTSIDHTNVPQESTSGSGTGIKFTIRVDNSGLGGVVGNPTVYISDNGTGYAVTDTVTITDPGITSNTALVTISSLGTKHNLAAYYTDHQHDAVGGSALTNGSGQKGSELTIYGFTNAPRIGQTFTMPDHDVLTTYTVLDVGTVSGGECIIEITPSIGPIIEPEIGQAGPVGDNVSIIFDERVPVYVVETGEVISADNVASVLQQGTPFSNTDSGNSTPIVFAGVPYEFKYRFSEQFVKSNEVSINSGRLQMRNFEIAYDRTGFFNVEVAPKPYDARLRLIQNRKFTGRRIGSTFLGKQKLDTGVFRVPVYVNSRDVHITVNSDSWLPVALQSADWEAFQVLRNQRI